MTATISRRTLFAAAVLALATPLVVAQSDFPNRPVKLVVGYSAGGGVDAVARMLAARLTPLLGQQVIVENKAGAAGMIAAETVARAPADGHTLLVGESGLLIAPHLKAQVPVDPLKAFTPVAGIFRLPLMIVANNDVPARDLKELVAQMKARPGKYSYATSGVGTVHHLGFETLKARTGAFVVHIPYRGASQIVSDVVSGQVPIGVVSAAAGLAQSGAGKLRAVAMMSSDKLPGTESIPSFASVVPGLDIAPQLTVLAPTGTPDEVVGRLDAAIKKVIADPELREAAARLGAVTAYVPAAQSSQDMARESREWAQVIQAQKLSVE